jgi:hypothetical protein
VNESVTGGVRVGVRVLTAGVRVSVAAGVRELLALPESELLGVSERDAVGVAVSVDVSDTDAVKEPEALTDDVVLGVAVPLMVRVGVPERVPVREPVMVALMDALPEVDGVTDALDVSDAKPLGEGVLVGSDVALALALPDDDGDGDPVGVPVGGGVSVLDALRVRLVVALQELVALGVRVRLRVALGVAPLEMLPDGVAVCDAATVSDAVAEELGLAETLALPLALGVTDAEGELDTVDSAVPVALSPQPAPGEWAGVAVAEGGRQNGCWSGSAPVRPYLSAR